MRAITNRRCLMCGRTNVMLWTLDNSEKASVMYLCKADAAPLTALMEAAGDLPPSRQVPVIDRGVEPLPRRRRQRGGRALEMAPLDWTPPAPPPIPAPPAPEPRAELTAEEQAAEDELVRASLAIGLTWDEIAGIVGSTPQDLQSTYGEVTQ